MYDVLGRAERKGREEGFKEGESKGRIKELFDLVLDGVLSLPVAAARANLSEQEFSKRAEEYRLSSI